MREKIELMPVYRRTFLHLRLLRRGQGAAVEQPPVTGPGRFSAEPPGSRLPGLLLTAGLKARPRLDLAESPAAGLLRRTHLRNYGN